MKKLFSLVLLLIIFIWIYAQQMIENPNQPLNEKEDGIPLVKRYRIEWKQYTKM